MGRRLAVITLALVGSAGIAGAALGGSLDGHTALVVSLVVAAAAAVMTWLGVRAPLLGGVRALGDATRRLASGDAEVRVRAPSRELGELARSIEGLSERMSGQGGALAHERDLMAGILEGMQDGVLLLDEQNRVALINPALRESLLIPPDVVGRPSVEVLRHAELQRIIAGARDRDDERGEGEIEVGGLKPRRLLVKASRLQNRPRWLLLVFLDVTELRRLESLRRDFVANVSHELRTPVTAIRSAAETLAAGALADAAAAPRFVDIVDRNAERLQRLVEDLLDLTKIESKQYQLDLRPVAIAPLAEHVFALLREQAAKKEHRLVPAIDEGLGDALADRRAIEQILTNLVDNAIKYCPAGKRITIRASQDKGRVRVAVEDTGPGIEEKHLARLFERFYRVDPGRSRDQGGTGLGLSIVKHLVEAMDGEVGVESPFGLGTTFWFTLPVAGEQAKR